MESGWVPRSMRIAAERMSSFARNRFRLETVSAQSAAPGNIITVNLPENSLLHMRSFKMHARVKTNALGDPTDRNFKGENENTTSNKNLAIFAKLPEGAESLISRVEVYLNGVQVQQGTQEYNTICRVMGLAKSNRPHKESVCRSMCHPYVDVNAVVDDETLTWGHWRGFLGEASTEYLPTDLLGQIQIRITLAGPEVLATVGGYVAKPTSNVTGGIGLVNQPNQTFTNGFFPDHTAYPAGGDAAFYTAILDNFTPTYSLSDIYFTIDTVQMDAMYGDMLRQKMGEKGYIPILYKEYYAFQTANLKSNAANMRFSLSSGSVDALYGVLRPGDYQTSGKACTEYNKIDLDGTPTAVPLYMPNALAFKSYEKAANTNDQIDKVDGSLRYHFTVNNVRHPQWAATVSNAIHDIAYGQDKVQEMNPGTLLYTRADFHEVNGLFKCLLSVPGEGVGVRSGYDSRGISSQFTFDVNSITAPSKDNETYSGMLIAECTQELRVAPGKSVAVSH